MLEDYTVEGDVKDHKSLFNKVSKNFQVNTVSASVDEAKMKKANEIYQKQSLFNTQIKVGDTKINPLVSQKLMRK